MKKRPSSRRRAIGVVPTLSRYADRITRLRHAMTLVELLVVIVLLTTLVTTAIPVMAPGGEDRKLREASRGLNSYLQGAQVRAMETGRPFGVAMRRLSADTGRGEDNAVCVQVRYVEVPPAYSGLDNSSLVRVCLYQVNPIDPTTRRLGLHFVRYGSQSNADALPPGYDADLLPNTFFRPGDTIEVGSHRFVLEGGTAQLPLTSQQPLPGTALRVPAVGGQNVVGTGTIDFGPNPHQAGYFLPIKADDIDPTSLRFTHDKAGNEITNGSLIDALTLVATAPAPYKIYRQPVSAGGEPLELPSGVAIDLQASAFGNGVRLYSPHVDYDESENAYTNVRNDDVMILFAPEGHIQRV